MSGDTEPIICYGCVFVLDAGETPGVAGAGPSRCVQYPDGIPQVILSGGDHRELRGDEAKGEAFKVRPSAYGEMMLEAWLGRAPVPSP